MLKTRHGARFNSRLRADACKLFPERIIEDQGNTADSLSRLRALTTPLAHGPLSELYMRLRHSQRKRTLRRDMATEFPTPAATPQQGNREHFERVLRAQFRVILGQRSLAQPTEITGQQNYETCRIIPTTIPPFALTLLMATRVDYRASRTTVFSFRIAGSRAYARGEDGGGNITTMLAFPRCVQLARGDRRLPRRARICITTYHAAPPPTLICYRKSYVDRFVGRARRDGD